MSEHDGARVKRVTEAIFATHEPAFFQQRMRTRLWHVLYQQFEECAVAVLDAVADDLRAEGWDSAIEAVAWCLDNGEPSATAALTYTHKNNPYRTTRGDA